MAGPAEQFAQQASSVLTAKTVNTDGLVHYYHGEVESTPRRVRIFTVAPDVTDQSVHDAFWRAASAWYNTHTHPHVATVHEHETDPRPWIAVEFVDGDQLRTISDELSVPAVQRLIQDTADALRNAALYNTLHLSLSPETVWVVETEDGLDPRLDDWGLERACQVAAGETPTTAYTAPELQTDPEAESEQADVYSLGAVTYFALAGHPPSGPTKSDDTGPVELSKTTDHPDIDEPVDDVIQTALAEQPGDRYESAYAFQTALSSALPNNTPATSTTGAEVQADDSADTETPNGHPQDAAGGTGEAETSDRLTDIAGIDNETATALRVAGYETPEHLAAATQDQLTDIKGVRTALAARVKTEVDEIKVSDSVEADIEELPLNEGDEDDTSGSVTRRATLGMLGLGTVGGAGWYLTRAESNPLDATEQPSGDSPDGSDSTPDGSDSTPDGSDSTPDGDSTSDSNTSGVPGDIPGTVGNTPDGLEVVGTAGSVEENESDGEGEDDLIILVRLENVGEKTTDVTNYSYSAEVRNDAGDVISSDGGSWSPDQSFSGEVLPGEAITIQFIPILNGDPETAVEFTLNLECTDFWDGSYCSEPTPP